ncbi:MAG: acyl carrier protein [Desulfatitalea sp. BRH_c12]|nr:MAG: acyl carrier protein [Desulfatitalea sp. BRH_c12]
MIIAANYRSRSVSDPKGRIKMFIVENFLFGNAEGLMDDTSFLEDGIIDSTGVLELVNFLEEEFSIKVEDEELVPENLDSINNLSAYLQKKIPLN